MLVRRLLRILWTAATISSLVLASAAALLWARSCRYHYGIERSLAVWEKEPAERHKWNKLLHVYGLSCGSGKVEVWESWSRPLNLVSPSPLTEEEWTSLARRFEVGMVKWERKQRDAGPSVSGWPIRWDRASFGPRQGRRALTVSFWPAVLIMLLLPGWRAVRWVRKNSRVGGCVACGYDLRATPDRCPECGSVATK
jgi:hypothetical protein